MFLWRNLPPAAIVAALRNLLTLREPPKATPRLASTPEGTGEERRQERLETAVMESQSRL